MKGFLCLGETEGLGTLENVPIVTLLETLLTHGESRSVTDETFKGLGFIIRNTSVFVLMG